MTEVPIFVPHGDSHLAAVVRLPDRDPRGLALLLTGIGLPPVIGSSLATRIARRLADDGVASVRFDWEGIGDSSGEVDRFSLSETESALAQALDVLATAQRVVGCEQFVVTGSCIGSRVALKLAPRPDCAGAVCLAAPILEQAFWTRASRSRLGSVLRAVLGSRRFLLSRAKELLGERRAGEGLVDGLTRALDHASVVLLYSASPRDYYEPRVQALLEEHVRRLPSEQQARYELRMLPAGPLTGFDALAPENQKLVVDHVVDAVLASFARAGSGAETAAVAT